MNDIKDDEWILLEEYRKAKRDRFADIAITIDKGELTKVDVTRKLRHNDLKPVRHLKEDDHAVDAPR